MNGKSFIYLIHFVIIYQELETKDIVDAVLYSLAAPPHVQVSNMLMRVYGKMYLYGHLVACFKCCYLNFKFQIAKMCVSCTYTYLSLLKWHFYYLYHIHHCKYHTNALFSGTWYFDAPSGATILNITGKYKYEYVMKNHISGGQFFYWMECW